MSGRKKKGLSYVRSQRSVGRRRPGEAACEGDRVDVMAMKGYCEPTQPSPTPHADTRNCATTADASAQDGCHCRSARRLSTLLADNLANAVTPFDDSSDRRTWRSGEVIVPGRVARFRRVRESQFDSAAGCDRAAEAADESENAEASCHSRTPAEAIEANNCSLGSDRSGRPRSSLLPLVANPRALCQLAERDGNA